MISTCDARLDLIGAVLELVQHTSRSVLRTSFPHVRPYSNTHKKKKLPTNLVQKIRPDSLIGLHKTKESASGPDLKRKTDLNRKRTRLVQGKEEEREGT
eukprot:1036291-Rhodomonas_salina.1